MFFFRLGATVSILRQKHVEATSDNVGKHVAEVLVRKVPDNQQVR